VIIVQEFICNDLKFEVSDQWLASFSIGY